MTNYWLNKLEIVLDNFDPTNMGKIIVTNYGLISPIPNSNYPFLIPNIGEKIKVIKIDGEYFYKGKSC